MVDVFDEMMRRSGLKGEVKLYPFRRVDIYLKAGKIDGTVAIFYKKSRQSYLAYVKTPYIESRTLVFTRKNSDLLFRKVEDLYNKNVGKISGWTVSNPAFNDAANKNLFKLEETTEFKHSLLKLIKGRIDYFVGPEQMTKINISLLKMENEIVPQKNPLANLAMHMAVSRASKKVKDPEKLADIIDQLIRDMISDGTLKKHMNRYHLRSMGKKP